MRDDDDDLTQDAIARLGRLLVFERRKLRAERRAVHFYQVILLTAIGLNLGGCVWYFTHP